MSLKNVAEGGLDASSNLYPDSNEYIKIEDNCVGGPWVPLRVALNPYRFEKETKVNGIQLPSITQNKIDSNPLNTVDSRLALLEKVLPFLVACGFIGIITYANQQNISNIFKTTANLPTSSNENQVEFRNFKITELAQ
jgi:hypothetical protein